MGEKIDTYPVYVLMTAAKNEAANITFTLESVIRQEVLPKCWVIVNDGSTDKTEEIIRRYQEKVDFIHVISNPPSDIRHFGSKVKALNQALTLIKNTVATFDFIGNLDADVSFEPNFYKKLIERLDTDPKVCIVGGMCHERRNGVWVLAHVDPDWTIGGATQFFRADFFLEVGGYPPLKFGSEDTVMEYIARDKGYNVSAENGVIFYHHKPRTSETGKNLCMYFKIGMQERLWGTHFVFALAKSVKRIVQKPYFLGALMRCAGYGYATLFRRVFDVPTEYVKIIRKQQMQRLKTFLHR